MFKTKKRMLGTMVFAMLFILVLLPINADAASKKSKGMSYQTYKTGDGVVCIVKNTKSYAVELHGEMVFYNAGKKAVGKQRDWNYCLEPKKSCVLFFDNPVDSKYKNVSYKSFKIKFTVNKVNNRMKYGSKYIKLKKNKTSKGVSVTFTNSSKKKFDFVHATIVYYDSKNKVIGASQKYIYCNKPKSKEKYEFRYPYDSNYQVIIPKKYKIYVDFAYYYE